MRNKKKKSKLYVCVVCGKDKKVAPGTKCCGKTMLSKDKVWPD